MRNEASFAPETSEIDVRLESYDDIFSDFDMRPYAARALSVDFLSEIKRAALDKGGSGIELILNVPADKRNEPDEAVIKERLAAHFIRHCRLQLKAKRRFIAFGGSMVLAGIFCMIAATFIVFEDPSRDLFLSFLVVFLEPAAWFLLWEGMDQLIFHSKSINPELEFYRKMAHENGNTHFKSY